MPRCYQLIGIPGSGKTTWVKAQTWAVTCAVASTDAYVEAFAEHAGKTYSEVFDGVMRDAVSAMAETVLMAKSMGQDVIWDQTSTTVASRRKKFNMLPNYEHIAVVFPTPASDELLKRLASRPGKHIPQPVIAQMISGWEDPTPAEGFKEIKWIL